MKRRNFAADSAAVLTAAMALVASLWAPVLAADPAPAAPGTATPPAKAKPAAKPARVKADAKPPQAKSAAPSTAAAPEQAKPPAAPGTATPPANATPAAAPAQQQTAQPATPSPAPPAPAPAARPADAPRDVAAETAWKAYEKRWSETNSYVAGFRQTIEVPEVGTKVESAGRFYFAKPDKVQWQYTEGPPQTVVGDGQWLWLYQPDLEQVYKIPYDKAFGRGGLVALLAGREGVSERYRATLDKVGDGAVRIRLTPLNKTDGDLEVTLAADTFDLRAVVVHDPAGSVTNMVFSDPVRNRGLEDSLFTFTPPEGVDIITDHEAGF